MEFQINVEELRKLNLLITTPMYGGNCTGSFAKSLVAITMTLQRVGVPFDLHFLFNESLIQRGRNYCADTFLRNEKFTHMLFIDSDIEVTNPNDVLIMLHLMATDPEKYHVMAGPYPKKVITWEKIKAAVDSGYADKDPNVLADFVGDFVLNFNENKTIKLDEPAEVDEAGTGFMMISREAYRLFDEAYPGHHYTPDHGRTKEFDGSRKIGLYFHTEVDPESNRYLSEDYWFCKKLKNAGGKIWLCPWVYLTHSGSYVFAGKLPAIAKVGALTQSKGKK